MAMWKRVASFSRRDLEEMRAVCQRKGPAAGRGNRGGAGIIICQS